MRVEFGVLVKYCQHSLSKINMAAWQSNLCFKFMFYCIWTFINCSLEIGSNFYASAKYIPSTKVGFRKEYKGNTQYQSYELFYTSVPSESINRKDFNNANVQVNKGRKEALRLNTHESQVLTSWKLSFHFFHKCIQVCCCKIYIGRKLLCEIYNRKQECITVGCVPPAAVAVCLEGGYLLQCMLGYTPWAWAWTPPGCGPGHPP